MAIAEIIAEQLWEKIEPILPVKKEAKGPGGRPRSEGKKILTGIIYVLRTGSQWEEVPRKYGSKSTVHRYFQEWTEAGVFKKLWDMGLNIYDENIGIEWEWQSVDGAMSKAPLGGDATGKNPTDRAKIGTKRSLLVDGKGIPLAIVVDGANVNDHLLLEQTLMALNVKPGIWCQLLIFLGIFKMHLCLDKAYDNDSSYKTVSDFGYQEHISRKGSQAKAHQNQSGKKARRWVVEAAHSWLNRFRKILVRFEKTEASYLALLHLACAITCFRKSGVLG